MNKEQRDSIYEKILHGDKNAKDRSEEYENERIVEICEENCVMEHRSVELRGAGGVDGEEFRTYGSHMLK